MGKTLVSVFTEANGYWEGRLNYHDNSTVCHVESDYIMGRIMGKATVTPQKYFPLSSKVYKFVRILLERKNKCKGARRACKTTF